MCLICNYSFPCVQPVCTGGDCVDGETRKSGASGTESGDQDGVLCTPRPLSRVERRESNGREAPDTGKAGRRSVSAAPFGKRNTGDTASKSRASLPFNRRGAATAAGPAAHAAKDWGHAQAGAGSEVPPPATPAPEKYKRGTAVFDMTQTLLAAACAQLNVSPKRLTKQASCLLLQVHKMVFSQ
jgi:hypothetical protein